MLCEKIALNDEGTANLYTYCLDPEISYGVSRTWPAVVIVPGGGYLISATKEGEAIAQQFLAHGYSCFVLRYATYLRDRESLVAERPNTDEHAHYPAQELQLMKALHLIRAHAAEWSIDPNAVFTCGFSAGGHISATVGCRWDDPTLTSLLDFEPQGEELRPTGCVLGYPQLTGNIRAHFDAMRDVPGNISYQADLIEQALFGHTHPTTEELWPTELVNYVGPQTAPIYLWHSVDDPVVDPKITTRFVLAMQEEGVPCEYHLYRTGGHGLAAANRTHAKNDAEVSDKIATWLPMAVAWMDEIAGLSR